MRNTRSQDRCHVSGCYQARYNKTRFCGVHQHRLSYTGHVNGRPIRQTDLKPHQKRAYELLGEVQHKLGIQDAIAVCNEILDHGKRPDLSPLRQHLKRLTTKGLTGLEMLSWIGAVYLYSHYAPHKLPDDQRLTHALARAVLMSRRRDCLGGDPKQPIYRNPTPRTLKTFGEYLRKHFAMFFAGPNGFVQWVEKQDQKSHQRAASMSSAFADDKITTSSPGDSH